MFKSAFTAALVLVALASTAEARPRPVVCVETGTVQAPSCMGQNFLVGVKSIKVKMRRQHSVSGHKANKHGHKSAVLSHRVSAQIVSHPSGCPSSSFCGCGASVRIFGRSVRELWLAANWFKFPRAEPAPRMVAVRRDGHHVFVLEHHLGGKTWLVYDANSGRHQTRIHARSIAGYQIVNPRAG